MKFVFAVVLGGLPPLIDFTLITKIIDHFITYYLNELGAGELSPVPPPLVRLAVSAAGEGSQGIHRQEPG